MNARLQERWQQLLPWLRLLRLHHPADLVLLLLPLLWGAWHAGRGAPAIGSLLLLLFTALVLRCMAWLVHDLISAYHPRHRHSWREVVLAVPRPLRLLLAAETALALLLLVLLGWRTLLVALAAGLLAGGYLWMRRRSYLGEALLALALAAAVPAAYTAAGVTPGKAAWLLFLGTTLWAIAYLIQQAALHLQQHARLGVRSVSMLFASADRWAVLALQAMALWALWLAGQQEKFGVFFHLGLASASALALYQQWLMRGGSNNGFRRAYLGNIWLGIAVFCGIAFHYLCPPCAGG